MKTCNILAKIDDSFRYLKALGIVWINGKRMRSDINHRLRRDMNADETEHLTIELYSVIKRLDYSIDNNFITNGISAKIAKLVLRNEFRKDCLCLNKLQNTGLVKTFIDVVDALED